MIAPVDVLVGDVMSRRVLGIRETDTLSDALRRFRLTGFRHLVVVDDAGTCVGVVSERTVAAAWPREAMSGIRRRVADVLGPRRPYAWVDDTARAAARSMLKGGVDALPVLGERGDLVGIVTAAELLPLLAASADEATLGTRG